MNIDRRKFITITSLAGLQLVGSPALRNCHAQNDGEVTAEKSAVDIPKFALLVGINEYPNLKPSEQLDGCENDVSVMSDVLKERFGFADDQIVTLINKQATGDAIRAQLQSIADRIAALPDNSLKAQVVFHFSGHGSQIADEKAGGKADELDGLDETYVPYDATRQGGAEDIRDDEMYEFVKSICNEQRANVWLIIDACHSGTSLRGHIEVRGASRIRELNRGLKSNADSGSTKRRSSDAKTLPYGAISLSACTDRQVEPEYREGSRSYGLLTRFLAQVLIEQPALSELTYEVLREAIVTRYGTDRSITHAPSPQLYGDAKLLKSNVLGSAGINSDPFWKVQTNGDDRGQLLMLAGSLHGVTAGSIYEVYLNPEKIDWDGSIDAATNNGESVCWIRIEQVDGTTSTGAVVEWDDEELMDARVPRSFESAYAVKRFHQQARYDLKLKIVRTNADGSDSGALTFKEAGVGEQAMTSVSSGTRDKPPGELPVTCVGDDESCDLLFRVDGDYGAFFANTGIPHIVSDHEETLGIPASLRGGWGPLELGEAKSEQLMGEFVQSFIRARNLLSVVAEQEAKNFGGFGLEASLMKVKLDDDFEIIDEKPWVADFDGTLVMEDLDDYAIRVRNTSKTPFYVTVLLVEEDMSIDVMFPGQDAIDDMEGQRLLPDKEKFSDAFGCNFSMTYPKDDIDYEPAGYGKRVAVVIATRRPSRFYMLEQDGLTLKRKRVLKRRDVTYKMDHDSGSLESILLEQVFFQSRSGDRPKDLYDSSWSAQIIEWMAVPKIK